LLFAGGLVASPAISSAQTFDTSGATVSCTTIIGSASIKPPITGASTGTAVIKVKAALAGCTVTGSSPGGLTIVSGKLSGTLNSTGAGGCGGLLMPATLSGPMVAKWKAGSGQKLDFTGTTASNGSIAGSVFAPGGGLTGAYGEFTLSGQTIQASSAFAGATPSIVAVTAEDVGNLGAQCAGSGIKTIHLSIGTVTL
jgi:hypothetical protein